MKRALWVTAFVLAGCSSSFQEVRIDAPLDAKVVIREGLGEPDIETHTPFVGRFEAVSLSDWAAYYLTFELDQRAAARYGLSQPITLYGKLVVEASDEISGSQTIDIPVPDEKIRQLVAGSRYEIEEHRTIRDSGKVLAEIWLRTAPF